MTVEKVYFQENFNVADFYWQAAGFFGSLEEGETKEDAMNKASKELRQYFMSKYPNAPLQVWQQSQLISADFFDGRPMQEIPIPNVEEIKPDPIMVIENDIRSFADAAHLKKVYGAISAIDKAIKPVYDETMERLMDKRITSHNEREEAGLKKGIVNK